MGVRGPDLDCACIPLKERGLRTRLGGSRLGWTPSPSGPTRRPDHQGRKDQLATGVIWVKMYRPFDQFVTGFA